MNIHEYKKRIQQTKNGGYCLFTQSTPISYRITRHKNDLKIAGNHGWKSGKVLNIEATLTKKGDFFTPDWLKFIKFIKIDM